MNPLSKNITLSGKRLRVWSGGFGSALLLLHSAWGDAEMSWAPVWNQLSETFTVIAPDLPGFGESDPLNQPSLAANANILKEVLDILNVERATIVGNSYGVSIAIEFASLFPGRTLRIVVVNGGYLPLLPGLVTKIISIPFVEKRFRALMRNFSYSDKAFTKAFPNPSRLPANFFDLIRQNEDKQAKVVGDTFLRQTRPQSRPLMPCTMIWGTGDSLISMKQAERIREWFGNPDFIAIDGAGHMPQIEHPGVFVEAIKKASGVI